MDKPIDAYEVEDQIALIVAERTARLLQDLNEIENRLDLVERVIQKALLN